MCCQLASKATAPGSLRVSADVCNSSVPTRRCISGRFFLKPYFYIAGGKHAHLQGETEPDSVRGFKRGDINN